VSVSDLDHHIFENYRRRATKSQRLAEEDLAGSDSALIERLRLSDRSYLKRAALLLFHHNPEKFVPGSYVKIGYFRGNSDLLYQDEVHGDLFTQVDKTIDLLHAKYLKFQISYKDLQRVETFPIPKEALREAVTNAILHKDYGSYLPIQISVNDDRIMIWNPGHIPQGWSIDSLLKKHPSYPINPEIANAFFRSGMIESWGLGIERIVEYCRKTNSPTPLFRFDSTSLWVEFPYPSIYRLNPEPIQKTIQKPREKTQEKLLALIETDPFLSLQELADKIGISRAGIAWQIKNLKKEKRLKRVGPDKGGSWKILK
jgi:ATP-dependent DNA helicase RecG